MLRGGYIVCGHCGRNLAVYHNRKGVPSYYCCRDRYEPGVCPKHGIVSHKVDEAVLAHLVKTLSDPAVIQQEIARQQEHGENAQADIAALDRVIAGVTRKQITLARRVADLEEDDAAAPPLPVELRSLAAQRQQLEEDRERAMACSSNGRPPRRA